MNPRLLDLDNQILNTAKPTFFQEPESLNTYELLENKKNCFNNPTEEKYNKIISLVKNIISILKVEYGDGNIITNSSVLQEVKKLNKNWMIDDNIINDIKIYQDYRYNNILVDVNTSAIYLYNHTNGIIFGKHPVTLLLDGGIGNIMPTINNSIYMSQELNPINTPLDRIYSYLSSILGTGENLLQELILKLEEIIQGNAELSLLTNKLNECVPIVDKILKLVHTELSEIEATFTSKADFADLNFVQSQDPYNRYILQTIAKDKLRNIIG